MAANRMRGGPVPAGGTPEGARVVQPSVNRAAAARMRDAMTPSGRPARMRLAPERLGADFFREALSELRKVHWPTPEQARNLTALVVGVSIAVGVVLGGVDFVLARVFKLILGA